ncbi:hypothetical protein [Streptomyces sp. NPDC001068]|uniref:hypothetical protein n=1 Tax=Streptomyces sp. NPDC001068 TaxID=3364544 RepID=UPI003695E264
MCGTAWARPAARRRGAPPTGSGPGYAARRLSAGLGGRSGTLGGRDTASAAAQDANSSRMDTPAAADGRRGGDWDAGMDAS